MTLDTHASFDSLLTRHRSNPILSSEAWPYAINTVFNPAATRLKSGDTLLLCRVEDRTGLSHLCAARSQDGVGDWRIDGEPTLSADPARFPEEQWGIEDARITWLEELGKYAVTYTAYSWIGPAVSLALTEDFRTFERLGCILPPEDKDAALLPRRIDGRWAMIHRPVLHPAGSHIWMSFSPDLKHWGDRRLVFKSRDGAWWDSQKIGLSTPPIETDDGWLMIYHGAKETVNGSIYRVGLAMLDRDDPSRCTLRSTHWIFGPREPYEQIGDVANVAFPCGHTIDGDTIRLYYGSADTSVGLATGSLAALVAWLKEDGSRPED